VAKCNRLDREFDGWPAQKIRSIEAPTLVIVGRGDRQCELSQESSCIAPFHALDDPARLTIRHDNRAIVEHADHPASGMGVSRKGVIVESSHSDLSTRPRCVVPGSTASWECGSPALSPSTPPPSSRKVSTACSEYRFHTDDGIASLADLFEGRPGDSDIVRPASLLAAQCSGVSV
jgi:hypothetical protein